jgi:hypothetical protein
MAAADQRVLTAIARAAAELTDASGVAIVVGRGQEVVVVAAEGAEPQRAVGDRLGPGDDTLSFVLAGGQSMSLAPVMGPGHGAPHAGTPANDAPRASICVPCTAGDAVIGALELRGPAGGAPLGIDAVRVAALLADVVTAELLAERGGRASVPAPGELGAELAQLAARDGARYEAIASAIAALLSGG